ncbi:MAG: carbamoyl-phosphate synthase small subunit [Desulfurococcaceae archaeon]|nr:MAG: carbamoyl-phosphate synthase small subunit [Desulfurococcaceae archaeon]
MIKILWLNAYSYSEPITGRAILESGRRGVCKRGLVGLLMLEDGSIYRGCGFGSKGTRVGEVVFTTSMVGYPESITDPSYKGQILVLTHPLIGNYGFTCMKSSLPGSGNVFLQMESEKPQIEGLVVFEETEPSHWSSEGSLHSWLEENQVPGLSRVDTRSIVRKLREHGTMRGIISVWSPDEGEPDVEELWKAMMESQGYDDLPLAYQVSPRKSIEHGVDGPVISIIDCGIKHGILREILSRGFRVIRYPCYTKPSVIVDGSVGVVISNGPGNPSILTEVIENVRGLIEYNIPVLGICLGHQLLSLALGGDVYKLRYGHRGANKPVRDLETGLGYISTQNHGYVVSIESLRRTGLRPWFINIDDGTLEGVKHETKPIMGVQFHPEAGPGPRDLSWVFDIFKKTIYRTLPIYRRI